MDKQFCIAKSVVRNSEWEILMVQRNRPGHYTHKNWELPGGKINYYENPRDAVIRETMEETGYIVQVANQCPVVVSSKILFPNHISHNILLGFPCVLKKKIKIPKDKNVLKIKWISIVNVINKEIECLPGTRQLIIRNLSREKNV